MPGPRRSSAPPIRAPKVPAWTSSEKLQKEFAAIGFFISGHPLDEYKDVLKRLGVQSYAAFAKGARAGRTSARLAGAVLDRTERRTRSGSKMGIVLLSDATAQYRGHPVLRRTCPLTARCWSPVRASSSRCGPASRARNCACASRPSSFSTTPRPAPAIRSSSTFAMSRALEPVARCLSESGDSQVSLIAALEPNGREVEIKLPGRYRTTPQIAGAIKAVPGVTAVELV